MLSKISITVSEAITKNYYLLPYNLSNVQTLLANLIKKNSLTRKQHNKISTKLNNLELGHFHDLHKRNKVKVVQSGYYDFCSTSFYIT